MESGNPPPSHPGSILPSAAEILMNDTSSSSDDDDDKSASSSSSAAAAAAVVADEKRTVQYFTEQTAAIAFLKHPKIIDSFYYTGNLSLPLVTALWDAIQHARIEYVTLVGTGHDAKETDKPPPNYTYARTSSAVIVPHLKFAFRYYRDEATAYPFLFAVAPFVSHLKWEGNFPLAPAGSAGDWAELFARSVTHLCLVTYGVSTNNVDAGFLTNPSAQYATLRIENGDAIYSGCVSDSLITEGLYRQRECITTLELKWPSRHWIPTLISLENIKTFRCFGMEKTLSEDENKALQRWGNAIGEFVMQPPDGPAIKDSFSGLSSYNHDLERKCMAKLIKPPIVSSVYRNGEFRLNGLNEIKSIGLRLRVFDYWGYITPEVSREMSRKFNSARDGQLVVCLRTDSHRNTKTVRSHQYILEPYLLTSNPFPDQWVIGQHYTEKCLETLVGVLYLRCRCLRWDSGWLTPLNWSNFKNLQVLSMVINRPDVHTKSLGQCDTLKSLSLTVDGTNSKDKAVVSIIDWNSIFEFGGQNELRDFAVRFVDDGLVNFGEYEKAVQQRSDRARSRLLEKPKGFRRYGISYSSPSARGGEGEFKKNMYHRFIKLHVTNFIKVDVFEFGSDEDRNDSHVWAGLQRFMQSTADRDKNSADYDGPLPRPFLDATGTPEWVEQMRLMESVGTIPTAVANENDAFKTYWSHIVIRGRMSTYLTRDSYLLDNEEVKLTRLEFIGRFLNEDFISPRRLRTLSFPDENENSAAENWSRLNADFQVYASVFLGKRPFETTDQHPFNALSREMIPRPENVKTFSSKFNSKPAIVRKRPQKSAERESVARKIRREKQHAIEASEELIPLIPYKNIIDWKEWSAILSNLTKWKTVADDQMIAIITDSRLKSVIRPPSKSERELIPILEADKKQLDPLFKVASDFNWNCMIVRKLDRMTKPTEWAASVDFNQFGPWPEMIVVMFGQPVRMEFCHNNWKNPKKGNCNRDPNKQEIISGQTMYVPVLDMTNWRHRYSSSSAVADAIDSKATTEAHRYIVSFHYALCNIPNSDATDDSKELKLLTAGTDHPSYWKIAKSLLQSNGVPVNQWNPNDEETTGWLYYRLYEMISKDTSARLDLLNTKLRPISVRHGKSTPWVLESKAPFKSKYTVLTVHNLMGYILMTIRKTLHAKKKPFNWLFVHLVARRFGLFSNYGSGVHDFESFIREWLEPYQIETFDEFLKLNPMKLDKQMDEWTNSFHNYVNAKLFRETWGLDRHRQKMKKIAEQEKAVGPFFMTGDIPDDGSAVVEYTSSSSGEEDSDEDGGNLVYKPKGDEDANSRREGNFDPDDDDDSHDNTDDVYQESDPDTGAPPKRKWGKSDEKETPVDATIIMALTALFGSDYPPEYEVELRGFLIAKPACFKESSLQVFNRPWSGHFADIIDAVTRDGVLHTAEIIVNADGDQKVSHLVKRDGDRTSVFFSDDLDAMGIDGIDSWDIVRSTDNVVVLNDGTINTLYWNLDSGAVIHLPRLDMHWSSDCRYYAYDINDSTMGVEDMLRPQSNYVMMFDTAGMHLIGFRPEVHDLVFFDEKTEDRYVVRTFASRGEDSVVIHTKLPEDYHDAKPHQHILRLQRDFIIRLDSGKQTVSLQAYDAGSDIFTYDLPTPIPRTPVYVLPYADRGYLLILFADDTRVLYGDGARAIIHQYELAPIPRETTEWITGAPKKRKGNVDTVTTGVDEHDSSVSMVKLALACLFGQSAYPPDYESELLGFLQPYFPALDTNVYSEYVAAIKGALEYTIYHPNGVMYRYEHTENHHRLTVLTSGVVYRILIEDETMRDVWWFKVIGRVAYLGIESGLFVWNLVDATYKFIPLLFYGMDSATVSPDGRFVAFMNGDDEDDYDDLFIREIKNDEVVARIQGNIMKFVGFRPDSDDAVILDDSEPDAFVVYSADTRWKTVSARIPKKKDDLNVFTVLTRDYIIQLTGTTVMVYGYTNGSIPKIYTMTDVATGVCAIGNTLIVQYFMDQEDYHTRIDEIRVREYQIHSTHGTEFGEWTTGGPRENKTDTRVDTTSVRLALVSLFGSDYPRDYEIGLRDFLHPYFPAFDPADYKEHITEVSNPAQTLYHPNGVVYRYSESKKHHELTVHPSGDVYRTPVESGMGAPYLLKVIGRVAYLANESGLIIWNLVDNTQKVMMIELDPMKSAALSSDGRFITTVDPTNPDGLLILELNINEYVGQLRESGLDFVGFRPSTNDAVFVRRQEGGFVVYSAESLWTTIIMVIENPLENADLGAVSVTHLTHDYIIWVCINTVLIWEYDGSSIPQKYVIPVYADEAYTIGDTLIVPRFLPADEKNDRRIAVREYPVYSPRAVDVGEWTTGGVRGSDVLELDVGVPHTVFLDTNASIGYGWEQPIYDHSYFTVTEQDAVGDVMKPGASTQIPYVVVALQPGDATITWKKKDFRNGKIVDVYTVNIHSADSNTGAAFGPRPVVVQPIRPERPYAPIPNVVRPPEMPPPVPPRPTVKKPPPSIPPRVSITPPPPPPVQKRTPPPRVFATAKKWTPPPAPNPYYTFDTLRKAGIVPAPSKTAYDSPEVLAKAGIRLTPLTYQVPNGYTPPQTAAYDSTAVLSKAGIRLTTPATATYPGTVVNGASEYNPFDLKDTLKPELEPAEDASSASREKVKWSDIVGLKEAKAVIQQTVVLPRRQPGLFKGRLPPTRILLYGPPGTGKSLLAKAAATELKSSFISVSASDIFGQYYGESEQKIKAIFAEARKKIPSVIFMDEVDSILSSREGGGGKSGELEKRIKNIFLTELDGVDSKANSGVIFMAATNLPWVLDAAMLSRFQRKVYIPLPDKAARYDLLKNRIERSKTDGIEISVRIPEDLVTLVNKTEEFSGRDLTQLIDTALLGPVQEIQSATRFSTTNDGMYYVDPKGVPMTVDRIPEGKLQVSPVNIQHFLTALIKVKPGSNPETLAKYVKWTLEFGTQGN